jgi:hypothetical protein
MLGGDRDGTCRIFDPALEYKLIVVHSTYEAAQEWLLEDEYERANGQLLPEKIL